MQPTFSSLKRLFKQIELPLNLVFVDIGCGNGTVLFYLAAHWVNTKKSGYHRLIGIDGNETCIHEAKRLKNKTIKDSLQFKHQDIMALTADDLMEWSDQGQRPMLIYSFDAYMSQRTVHHIAKCIQLYRGKAHVAWISSYSSFFLKIPMTPIPNGCLCIGTSPPRKRRKKMLPDKSHMKTVQMYVYSSGSRSKMVQCKMCQTTPSYFICPICATSVYCSKQCIEQDMGHTCLRY